MTSIKDMAIQNEIDAIKNHTGWSILLMTEVGSLAQGLESQKNLYNMRFVYLRTKKEYISPDQHAETCTWIQSPELEIIGWDLSKFIKEIKTSNPTAFEWLTSDIVYEEDPSFIDIRNAANQCFDANHSLLHYSIEMNTNLTHLKCQNVTPKQYISTAYTILAARHVFKTQTPAPIKFELLLQNLNDTPIKIILNSLVIDKKCGLGDTIISNNEELESWFRNETNELTKAIRPDKPKEDKNQNQLEDLFMRMLDTRINQI